ncbi:peptidase M36 [Thamnocephalis sphaerospora]|uniref:Extracellular metalloproteinase n=1 Tax=Thamnocephalis sphaerospora TaxID=78915 RepID=A0A4P9XSC0_9FUNG|nr:peptidase M36 [Thamnocephalis sphaerospora]|eukprot:RKP09034.1 peptidase M36 [Thamnocephalis sphaerospora]
MHDLTYRHGFIEAAGNFQQDNFGRGGLGNDPIVINFLEGMPYARAEFVHAPDGERPQLNIRSPSGISARNHLALNNDVLVHEYIHGLVGRLVGGPLINICMAYPETAAISEGAGDFVALLVRMRATTVRSARLSFGSREHAGSLRSYPYSADMSVNPTRYDLLNNKAWRHPHKMGEVWASVLLDMYWNLVDKLGFDTNLYSARVERGNTLALKLLIASLQLMPCNASLTQARNALLEAERQLTLGAHQCELWKAFAKRGLGVAARGGDANVVADGSVPQECMRK